MYAKDKSTIIDRREMLRVKVISLMAEAMIIRREEQKTHGQLRIELHDHRVKELRYEARASHIAYGFIRGKTIEQMEPCNTPGNAYKDNPQLQAKVQAMVKKYGPVSLAILKKAA